MRHAKLLIALICLAPAHLHAAARLVHDGQACSSIAVPREATPTVRFAAGELARYIEAISGAKIGIVAEGDSVTDVTIHVGPTSAAREALPPQFAQHPESVFVRATDTRLIICGGSDRGTLFAVYRFLEQALHCRWLTQDIEFVPRRRTIDVSRVTIATTPAFDMRTFGARRENQRAWGPKVGMNGFYSQAHAATTGNGYYFPESVRSCHAYCRIIPSERYFKEHTEWFPLLNGTRQPGQLHGRQLCVTATGLADEFAKNVIKLFDEDANLQIVSISPNDGRGWCECEACMDLDKRLCGGRTTKQGLANERPFRGDRVFWFANDVAKRVAEEHPDKLLLVLAYINYAEPPDTIKPAPNVVPWLCHYAPADYSRPISDPTSESNAQFNALLKRWAASAPHMLFYSYVSKSMWWRLPRPAVRGFAADIKHLHRLGIRRYYCQSSLHDWPLDGPLYYVISKLLWDPAADPEVIANDWIQHMFGPAAEAMREFYDAVYQSVQKTGQSYSDNPPNHVPGLYHMPDLERALHHIREAEAAAKDEDIAGRVKRVADVFRYGYHMVCSIEAARRFRAEPTVAVMGEAMTEGKKALKICRVREAARFVDSLRMHDAFGVVARGFGTGQELGGRRCWNSDETGLGDNRSGWATIAIETPDTNRPVRLEMDVWGKSQLTSVVVNTGGQGKGYSDGGIWKPVKPQQPLSDKEQWDTLVFIIPPKVLAADKKVQTIGFGGSDSQIWISAVRVQDATGDK